MPVSTMILLAEYAIIGVILGWMGRGLRDEWKWEKP